ncbi:MAG: Rrf2 family transcriptional regulator [Patescibacteria group bacterium]
MRFSKKTDYAIIFIDALKQSYFSGGFESVVDIAKAHRMSKLFLEKIAQELREEGVVQSHRGRAGGYRLVKNPSVLTLFDVISIFEKTDIRQRMKSLNPDIRCPAAKLVPQKKRWTDIEEKIKNIFQETTFV